MDPTRAKPPARNGAGLRQSYLVQGSTEMVGAMGPRAPGVCPYRLGTSCPLVEVAKGKLKRHEALRRRANYMAISLGLILSVVAVRLVYL